MEDTFRMAMHDSAGDLTKDRLDGQVLADIAPTLRDLREEIAFEATIHDHVEEIVFLDHLV